MCAPSCEAISPRVAVPYMRLLDALAATMREEAGDVSAAVECTTRETVMAQALAAELVQDRMLGRGES